MSTLKDRLLSKVDRTPGFGPGGDCWKWLGSQDGKGYGRIGIGSKTDGTNRPIAASRASWIVHNGPIPEGMWVLHRCDNPQCTNPAHLFLGSSRDNVVDMFRKGRDVQADRRGTKNGRSRLTEAQVLQIRNDGRHQRTIAADYGVSKSTIGYIKRGETWR